ncbi:MAG: two-component system, OmpR family, sensor kinase [Actinomycetota bacterium]|jgi:signal transduction histidine kinase|nr:two-component system, OmpR family, sensor kinase [Actinomycetota bacterium]
MVHLVRITDADHMPRSAPRPEAPQRTARTGWLPQGRALSDAEFTWRHRIVCGLLAAHIPAIAVITVLRHYGPLHALVEITPVAVLLAAALAPISRRAQALAASLGLVTCSALLVHLFSGSTELHFHYFVVIALIALYQDWTVYALAIAFVALQHGAVGVLDQHSVYDHGGNPWLWALIHAGFVLAESGVLVIFWYASEQTRRVEDRLRAELSEGKSSVRARLEETDRIRADLIATVSHEFRTPLTGIRGAALTLLKRGDRLDEQSRQRLLAAVLDQQERLSRLLENMLTAARATAADPTAMAEVDGVAAEVAMLAGANRPDSPPVSVVVEGGTVARIDRHALHQVLANLVDNAQQHGSAGAVPILAGGRDDAGVWITVSNEGRTLDDDDAGRLFEPFTQGESGATRDAEGMGMGLYVVRRLVEVYGGTVDVRSEGGWVTVELHLRPGSTALPTSRSELVAG